MDIKVLKNFDVKKAEFVNKNLVLSFHEISDKQMGRFTARELFLINPDTNEKVIIAPEIDKYFPENVIYASANRDYVVFPTLQGEPEAAVITWYIYKCYDGSIKQLHSMSIDLDVSEKTEFIKMFVLDEFHMLIQKENVTDDGHKFTFKMYNSDNGVVSDVTIPRLVETGITQMEPLSDGICALKFGRSFTPDKPFGYKPSGFNREIIGTVPVNKLISELAIDMDNRFVEVVEADNELTTLPYMKVAGSLIIYAVYYPSEEKEDIIIYDSESGNKKVRLNSRLSSINDLWHTFVIGDDPYLISGSGKGSARITDLNTQKVIAKLGSGDDIPAVCGNYVVLTGKKRKLLKDIDYVEVYEFSKLLKEAAFSVKASFEYCLVCDDTMILFINDNRSEDERYQYGKCYR